MNKEFGYQGYTFNINVELNTSKNNFSGESYHTVICNDMGGSNHHNRNDYVKDASLISTINDFEKLAKAFVDKKDNIPTATEKILNELGFS